MSRWLVLSLALAAGCRDPGIEKLGGIRDRVCACKTASCAEDAMKAVPVDVTSNHKSQKIAREMMDCLALLYEKERPVTGPDDQSAPAPATP